MPARGHAFGGCLLTSFFLVAIFYGGVFLACRTDGFRSYAEDFLERRLGIPVHVKRIQATPSLKLVLTGVVTEGGVRKGVPGYRVREAIIQWSVMNALRSRGGVLSALELKGFGVSFAPGPSGEWAPAAFAQLGSWVAEWGRFDLPASAAAPVQSDRPATEEADSTPAPSARGVIWDCINLSISDGEMSWWDADKRELASVSGVRFEVTPIRLPNRKMTHYFLALDSAQIGPRRSVRDFTFEMLKMASNSIVITCTGEWGGAPD